MNKTHETFVSNGIDDTLGGVLICIITYSCITKQNTASLFLFLFSPYGCCVSLFTSLSPTSYNLSVLPKKILTENFGAKILILILKNHHFWNEWNLWFKTKTSCVREFSSYLVPSLGQSLSKLVGIKETGTVIE